MVVRALNAATGDRFQWLIFDQQGLAPVGFALFAAAAAAFIGAATGRTLRAMALTALAYLFTRAVVAIVLRPRFMAPLERRYPVLGARVPNRLLGDWLWAAAARAWASCCARMVIASRAASASVPRPTPSAWPRSAGSLQPRAFPSGEPILDVPGDRDHDLRGPGARVGGCHGLVDPPSPRVKVSFRDPRFLRTVRGK